MKSALMVCHATPTPPVKKATLSTVVFHGTTRQVTANTPALPALTMNVRDSLSAICILPAIRPIRSCAGRALRMLPISAIARVQVGVRWSVRIDRAALHILLVRWQLLMMVMVVVAPLPVVHQLLALEPLTILLPMVLPLMGHLPPTPNTSLVTPSTAAHPSLMHPANVLIRALPDPMWNVRGVSSAMGILRVLVARHIIVGQVWRMLVGFVSIPVLVETAETAHQA